MCVDVADFRRVHVRAREGGTHHLGHPDGGRVGRGHVVRVVRRAVAEDFGVDLRPALLGGLEILEQENAGALPHDEAGARGVEGA